MEFLARVLFLFSLSLSLLLPEIQEFAALSADAPSQHSSRALGVISGHLMTSVTGKTNKLSFVPSTFLFCCCSYTCSVNTMWKSCTKYTINPLFISLSHTFCVIVKQVTLCTEDSTVSQMSSSIGPAAVL